MALLQLHLVEKDYFVTALKFKKGNNICPYVEE
jgi:hypothetical protein